MPQVRGKTGVQPRHGQWFVLVSNAGVEMEGGESERLKAEVTGKRRPTPRPICT